MHSGCQALPYFAGLWQNEPGSKDVQLKCNLPMTLGEEQSSLPGKDRNTPVIVMVNSVHVLYVHFGVCMAHILSPGVDIDFGN